jgi:uncharacterized protein YndB with AHSA1/START domain
MCPPKTENAEGRHAGDLVYTWSAGEDRQSLVTVRFEPRGDATEVIVVHEQIVNETLRESHEMGWAGCLEGLERYFENS